MDGQYILVADIGGTRIRIGLIDQVSGVIPFEPAEIWSSILDDDEPVAILAKVFKDYIDKQTISPLCIVIGFPGLIDVDNDLVLMCNNIPSLKGRYLASELRSILDKPIFIEHDARLLLLGEASFLSKIKAEITLGIFFGTGIGADAILADKDCPAFRQGFELGHMPLSINGERCVCGKIGCAESFINGHKLREISDEANIPIAEIFTHWQENSRLGERLKTFLDYQAMIAAIATIIINPDLLIIGGGIVSMAGYPKEYLAKTISGHFLNTVANENLTIKWAALGDSASFYGGRTIFNEKIKPS